jgi:F-BAR domain only protein
VLPGDPGLLCGNRIFMTPWQKIIAATESIAESHQNFAANIEKDVEQPLRTFTAKNREMQAMSTIQGNLVAIQKELDEAQQKADKLGKKGGKANSLKVDNASQKLDSANSQWDSQAPFVFEKLQAVDESRLNHLRDVLTQYQTHEADQVARNRVTAESTLNSLLEIDTSQEIQNFARNVTQGKPKIERSNRRTSSSAGSNTLPPPPISKNPTGDGRSEHSGTNEGPSGLSSYLFCRLEALYIICMVIGSRFYLLIFALESKSGLKRFGTMLGRRRQSVHGSFVRAPSPPKGINSPFGRAPGSRDGRPTPSPRASSNNLRDTPSRDNRLSSLVESPTSPTNRATTSQSERRRSNDGTNGESAIFRPGSLLNPEVIPPKSSASEKVNGTASKDIDVSDVQPPPGPPPSHLKGNALRAAEHDSDGFTIPLASNDPISQAQQEAANETDQPQFKLDIKNEPIREEDADAQAALSNVANTLRSSTLTTPSRKAGTVRGRRDVRNTIYVPAPEVSENDVAPSLGQNVGSNRTSAIATLNTEQSLSDTQSIRSAHSLTGGSVVKHPDMHQPGLNSSIVETVSALFENGEIKTGTVIGEIALAYGPSESAPTAFPGKIANISITLRVLTSHRH